MGIRTECTEKPDTSNELPEGPKKESQKVLDTLEEEDVTCPDQVEVMYRSNSNFEENDI